MGNREWGIGNGEASKKNSNLHRRIIFHIQRSQREKLIDHGMQGDIAQRKTMFGATGREGLLYNLLQPVGSQ